MLSSAIVLALLLALCQGPGRLGGHHETFSDIQKQETHTRSAFILYLVQPYKKYPDRKSKRGVWGIIPEQLNTFGKQVKQIQVSEIKHNLLAVKNSQVQKIWNYLLRKKNTRTQKNSRVQNIWNKLF